MYKINKLQGYTVQNREYSQYFIITINGIWVSLIAQLIKNLLAVQEAWIRSLGQEDPLEEEMATHSSSLVWRIPWTEEPGGLMGSQRIGHH